SDSIGEGTRIWQFVVILPNARIGKGCNICSHVFIESDVVIGDYTTIKNGVHIWNGVRIGDKVFVGPHVAFTNDLTPRAWRRDRPVIETRIHEGATIGANATILAGCTIGRYAMVGAGSVVTRDVGDFELWYGVPAMKRGYVTREGHVLTMDLKDPVSGVRFFMTVNGPVPETC
ncbi:MAG: acyltransferase, partial [Candidatus Kryptoniota bacterium]